MFLSVARGQQRTLSSSQVGGCDKGELGKTKGNSVLELTNLPLNGSSKAIVWTMERWFPRPC